MAPVEEDDDARHKREEAERRAKRKVSLSLVCLEWRSADYRHRASESR